MRRGRVFPVLLVSLAVMACAPTPDLTRGPTAPPTVVMTAEPTPLASPTPTPSASPTAAPTTAETAIGRLTLRAGWTVWQPNLHAPWNDGPLLYLSNVPLDPDCAVMPPATPHPADAGGRACRSPVSSLPPGGVLVTWYTSRILFPVTTHGEVIPYGDRDTHLSVERPGNCADIAGDVTVDAYMPQGNGTLSNVQVIGCARDPAPTCEREFRALLGTLEWSGG